MVVLADVFILLFEHLLALLAEVYLIGQVVGLLLQLEALLVDLFDLDLQLGQRVLLLKDLLAVSVLHVGDFSLPFRVLPFGVGDGNVLHVYLLDGVLHHVLNYELAVTQCATLAAQVGAPDC